jgi:hypothetical protein
MARIEKQEEILSCKSLELHVFPPEVLFEV